jgi:hypothetical protein
MHKPTGYDPMWEIKNKLNPRVILESCQTRSFTCHASPSKSDQHRLFQLYGDLFIPLT